MKFLWPLCIFIFISCSSMPTPQYYLKTDGSVHRGPAQEISCFEAIKNFFKPAPPKTLNEVLVEKKLLTFTEKKAQIHYPRLEWINKVKKSLNQTLRNWNNFRYPAFYLFNEAEIVPLAKKYAENLHKIEAGTVPLEDEEITKSYLAVTDWMNAYQNYHTELEHLLEERISLQYNISLLKRIDFDDSDIKEIEIVIKQNGVLKKEIVTLRKEDKNLKAQINKLKEEMQLLDGSFLKNGHIKERIIRQAMLKDILTIVHRELEFVIKNTPSSAHLTSELDKLNNILKTASFLPSTYGVYKVENKIFLREMISLTRLDKAYEFVRVPVEKIKTILSEYFKSSPAEKEGILKRLYAKITSLTPAQVTVTGGSIVVGAVGIESYFSLKEGSNGEKITETTLEELNASDQATEPLATAQETELERAKEQHSVIEVHIDELTKK